MWLAASAAFNGDKGGHLKNFIEALTGSSFDAVGISNADDEPSEPIDLESERAKEIQAEMEAEAAMFERTIQRHLKENGHNVA